MAGHNKWSQIKHKKAKEDAKKGKAFTKLIKEITMAAREGGGNPDANPKLRLLLEKGRQLNMPLDNATRAIKRGTGELPGVHYEEFTYEGYGPGGIAVLVETLSDNKNRTIAELRHLFNSKGGSIGESGSVSWMFDHKGVVRIAGDEASEDALLEMLLEHDVDNVTCHDGLCTVLCNQKSIDAIKKVISSAGLKIESAEIEWVAKNPMELSDAEADKAVDFLSALQDLEDVQNVYTNLA